MSEPKSIAAETGRREDSEMNFFKWLRGFVVTQRCLPWRVRRWLGKRYPKLLVFLQTGHTNLNSAKYWDKKWRKAGPNSVQLPFLPRVSEIVGPGGRVLDVGCGGGALMNMLRSANGCECTGVDISRAAIDMINEQGMGGVVAELPSLPFPDDTFDCVVSTEVLEHLDDPRLTIREMARVVRPSGEVIVSVPDDAMGTEDILEHMHVFNWASLEALLGEFLTDVCVEAWCEDDTAYLLGWGHVPPEHEEG